MRLKTLGLLLVLTFGSAVQMFGQTEPAKDSALKSEANKKEDKKKDSKENAPAPVVTAENVAEGVIIAYGGFLGRKNFEQIRKTTIERGKITTFAGGKSEVSTYERWVLRGEDLTKEKIRIDRTVAGAKFSLIYDGQKLFGLYNETVFTPRQDAAQQFRSQIFNGVEAVLRYKENGSTLELSGRDKVMGVEYYLLDVTDKQGYKTRFYVSVKTLRVMMLEYEVDGVKFKRKFYDHNVAQGTLVAFRTMLFLGDTEIEETEVGTITFGQKVDEALFQQS